ncbi:response regulator [Thermanaerosceptrum fracticalcis]|uniref:Stage 0 sporulation protein A homolog n=1 Tax=Thermanaerosceptrum fracticalcis TaxID=1712410 RepID=A0A7G6E267_THEFR|nr:response regulator [Thermanaerosceptrum fracticalcis]QNB46171.1 response regulator [Thermanaerosceptrum fracticalcis]
MEKVLIVDDNEQNCDLMKDILANWGYEVYQAFQGREAINLTLEHQPDVILLDVMLPGMNGFEVCHELKNNPRTQDIPIIMLTVLNDVEDRLRGFKVGAEIFLSKPINYNELKYRIASLIKQKKVLEKMEHQCQVVETLLEIMKTRDQHLYLHVARVREYCRKVAKLLALPDQQQEQLLIGASLHDIGKIVTGSSPEHTWLGERMVQPLQMGHWLKDLVRGHHEKLNGQGFPAGLKEKEIPWQLQILAGVNRFVELWEEQGSKEVALILFGDEVKGGCWAASVEKALGQVLEDEKFIERLTLSK